ncbi:flagellar hook-length control protein FliK [Maritimibacter sp. HL-12]|uniref:flagellar hook-length control protein FliK n=1 Tax=Maritimibacter sp. HL-12 TaxID=1162418 RepID=UPI000A0F3D63|nr:flagellar hook-length control protein FliK [Maritimibacter sp. HL-12]SMH42613.1 Flagellar hook-length control protein [Maritimibacter sp. HL-12]
MQLPTAFPLHATTDGNGSFPGPAGRQPGKEEMGDFLDRADGVFVIGLVPPAGVAEDWSHRVGPEQHGRAPASPASAGVREMVAVGSGSVKAGPFTPATIPGTGDQGGSGKPHDGRAIAAGSPDQRVLPATIHGGGLGGDGPSVIPESGLKYKSGAPSGFMREFANETANRGGQLIGPAPLGAGVEPSQGSYGSISSGDAGLVGRRKGLAANLQGNTAARDGVVAHVAEVPARGSTVPAQVVEGLSTNADPAVAARPGEGQRYRGAADHQVGFPQPDDGGIVAKDRANTAGDETTALKPDTRTLVLARTPEVSNPGLPRALDDMETRGQSEGQSQNAEKYRLANGDRAPATLAAAAVTMQSGGTADNVDPDPVMPRSFTHGVERSAQGEVPNLRAPEPSQAMAAATVTRSPQISPRAESSPTEATPSPNVDGDPLRLPDAVPGDLRNAEIASSTPAPNPVSRMDQGRAIALQIAEVLRVSGDRAVELRLQPEELGRVSLTMSQEGGHLQVTLVAERPETLELMRRHIDLLGEELRRLGHGSVQFLFEDGAGQNRQRAPQTLATAEHGGGGVPAENDPPPTTSRRPQPGMVGLAGGLDIRM